MELYTRKRLAVVSLMVLAGLAAHGAELWVDNVGGSDTNSGSQVAPFRTVGRAVLDLKPGVSLNLKPTSESYPAGIRITVSGTPESPIIIDGHGIVVSGMRRLPGDHWKSEGGDVFSRPLPNNAWGMATHWEGGFELVRFAGQPGRNVTSLKALEPLSCFLYKNQKELKTDPRHNTLYIRLPAGKTPDDMIVESIAASGGIYVGGSYVTVRNLVCEYAGDDGFATHRNRGVTFENVESRYNMDQGMSHHGAEVVVRNAHFHHNAGCGVVDVYPEAKVRYEHCLIESDTWRGGVEFHSGVFEMVDCLIRGNPKRTLTATKGARVKLRNCLLVAPEAGTPTGVSVDGAGSSLDMENCTIYGFSIGVNAQVSATTRVKLTRCAWVRCKLNSRISSAPVIGEKPVEWGARLSLDGNFYEPAPWEVIIPQLAAGGGWKTERHVFAAGEHARFAEWIGCDTNATMASIDGEANPLMLPPFRTTSGSFAGAKVTWPCGNVEGSRK
jgi:hypothetical protein